MSNKCATQSEIKSLNWGGDKVVENNSKLCTIGYALSHLGAKRNNGYTDTSQYPDNRIITLDSTSNPIEVGRAKTKFFATYPVFRDDNLNNSKYFSKRLPGVDTDYINTTPTGLLNLPPQTIDQRRRILLMTMRVKNKDSTNLIPLYIFDSPSDYRFQLTWDDNRYIECFNSCDNNPYGYDLTWQRPINNKLYYYLRNQRGETIKSGYITCVHSYNIPTDVYSYDQSSVIGSQGRFVISDIVQGSVWIISGENEDWANSRTTLNIIFDQFVSVYRGDGIPLDMYKYAFTLEIRFTNEGVAALKITQATPFTIDLDI